MTFKSLNRVNIEVLEALPAAGAISGARERTIQNKIARGHLARSKHMLCSGTSTKLLHDISDRSTLRRD